jgi:phospholipase D1/2
VLYLQQTICAYGALQHEKLCVIDSAIAFMGGLDLCFGRCVPDASSLTFADYIPLGRWDTPQHALVDDPEEGEEMVWPGAAELTMNPA